MKVTLMWINIIHIKKKMINFKFYFVNKIFVLKFEKKDYAIVFYFINYFKSDRVFFTLHLKLVISVVGKQYLRPEIT